MWKLLLVMTLLLTATVAPADEPDIVKVAGEPGVLAFSGNNVWGIVCGGLACWDRNTGEGVLHLSEDWLAGFGFRDMGQDNQGRLWLAGQDGLAMFDGTGFTLYTETDARPHQNSFRTMCLTSTGTIWLACGGWRPADEALVVCSFDGGQWKYYGVNDGIPGDYIRFLLEDRNGRIVAGTNKQVAAFDGNRWLPVDSTELAGLRGEGWRNHPLAGHPVIYTGLFPIPTDSRGNGWLVHENHLAFYDGTDIIPVDSVIIPDSERWRIFRPLAVDSCDVVWLSLDGCLAAYDTHSCSLRRFSEPVPTHAFTEKLYPNPFSPSYTFFFWLASAGDATIEFINHSGNTVRAITFNPDGPGRYRSAWNGLNDKCERVESGIYTVRISQQGSSFTREKAFILLR